jgi:hypothetical protein
MSKTQLSLFAIIAISTIMVFSVQYSEAAKDSKTVVEIVSERNWEDTPINVGTICNEQSSSAFKNGYFVISLMADGHQTMDEESIKSYFNNDGELIGTSERIVHGDIEVDEDGKSKFRGINKVRCYNGEGNSTEPFVEILHKNGKTTEN